MKVKKSTQRLNSFKIQCCFLLIRIRFQTLMEKSKTQLKIKTKYVFCIVIHYHSIIYNSKIKEIIFWLTLFFI